MKLDGKIAVITGTSSNIGAGLAEGVHAFSARIDGGVSELSRAVDLLGQVLVAVAGAYQETDAGAMPSAPTG